MSFMDILADPRLFFGYCCGRRNLASRDCPSLELLEHPTKAKGRRSIGRTADQRASPSSWNPWREFMRKASLRLGSLPGLSGDSRVDDTGSYPVDEASGSGVLRYRDLRIWHFLGEFAWDQGGSSAPGSVFQALSRGLCVRARRQARGALSWIDSVTCSVRLEFWQVPRTSRRYVRDRVR